MCPIIYLITKGSQQTSKINQSGKTILLDYALKSIKYFYILQIHTNLTTLILFYFKGTHTVSKKIEIRPGNIE